MLIETRRTVIMDMSNGFTSQLSRLAAIIDKLQKSSLLDIEGRLNVSGHVEDLTTMNTRTPWIP
jgi:hypothetical protein